MDEPPMPTSYGVVTVALTSLTLQDMRVGDGCIGTADLFVGRRSDDSGDFCVVGLIPRQGMPTWIGTIIGLPRMDFADGIEWVELEVWNGGSPLKVVVDATDLHTECFEIAFCQNDTVWEGWKTFRVPLAGPGFKNADVSLDEPPHPPVRIKWMIVIMRQGQPWELGLRELRIKPLKRSSEAGS